MFDCPKYKDFAKIQLRGRWTVPVMTVLVTMIFIRVFNIPMNLYIDSFGIIDLISHGDINGYINACSEMDPMIVYGLAFLVMIVSFVLEMASIHLYLKMSRSPEPVAFGDYVEGFSSWWRAIKAGLWEYLFIFLWSCLFIIPGLVKAFAYSQVFYLLDEFPNLTVRKAMKISMKITKGHKMNLFLMFLSFFGWFLLVPVTMSLINFWLIPYMSMTSINAYHAILKEAVDSGKITIEELRNEK